jgi:hypothetical protein
VKSCKGLSGVDRLRHTSNLLTDWDVAADFNNMAVVLFK